MNSSTIELPLKLRLSPHAGKELVERAARTGQDVGTYASGLIEQAVSHPPRQDILSPFREQVRASRMSVEQFDSFVRICVMSGGGFSRRRGMPWRLKPPLHSKMR